MIQRRKSNTFRMVRSGGILAISCTMTWDIAFGRWLALCAHPICAWRVRSRRARALVVTTYFAAGYVAALLVLMVRNSS